MEIRNISHILATLHVCFVRAIYFYADIFADIFADIRNISHKQIG